MKFEVAAFIEMWIITKSSLVSFFVQLVKQQLGKLTLRNPSIKHSCLACMYANNATLDMIT